MASEKHALRRGRGGRKPKKTERQLMLERLETALRLGATDHEAARLIGIDHETLRRKALEDPEVESILRVGNGAADARVEQSLYRRAVGYTKIVRKVVAFQGAYEIAEIEEEVDPDPGCMRYWLEKRKPEQWGTSGTDLTIDAKLVGDGATHIRVNYNIRGKEGLMPIPATYLKANEMVEDAEVIEE